MGKRSREKKAAAAAKGADKSTPKRKAAAGKPGFWAWLWESVNTLVIAFVLAIFIRAFFFQAYFIPSGSMIPTFEIKDRLIVNKMSFGLQNPLNGLSDYPTFLSFVPNPMYQKNIPFSGFKYFWKFNKSPRRFDIVIFRSPQGWGKDLIKRVIGLPGEKVSLKNGDVYIDGKILEEKHLMIKDQCDFGPVTVPEKSYFVMGDNRPDSNDSRYWGFLPEENILGKSLFTFWPLNRLRVF
jgi:signal peptidase I